MNINFEDINQSKQKQDVINSSDSDIDPQRQEAPNHENEEAEGEYPSQENSIDEVPEEEMLPQGFEQRKSSSTHRATTCFARPTSANTPTAPCSRRMDRA